MTPRKKPPTSTAQHFAKADEHLANAKLGVNSEWNQRLAILHTTRACIAGIEEILTAHRKGLESALDEAESYRAEAARRRDQLDALLAEMERGHATRDRVAEVLSIRAKAFREGSAGEVVSAVDTMEWAARELTGERS